MPSDPIWRQLILQVVLILFSALIVAAEAVVSSLNENRLHNFSEQDEKKLLKLTKIAQNPNRLLSATHVCATVILLFSAGLTATRLAPRLALVLERVKLLDFMSQSSVSTLAFVLAIVVLGYFILVFGTFVPRRVALHKLESAASFTLGLATLVAMLLRPIIFLLVKSSNIISRLFGVAPGDEGESVSEDQIRMMMDMGEEAGAIESTEKEMIENVFEFNNMTAEDVMVHRTDMVVVWDDDTPDEIIHTIESSGLSRFPYCTEDVDDIVGILNTREYLLNARGTHSKPISEILRSPYFVPESVRADVLFRDMQSKKVHMAIVVDEYGGTSGLVTMEDLLETIVGNIYDEFDNEEEQEITCVEDNLWRISGSAELEDIAEALAVEIPDDDEFETLGGLVFSRISVIPDNGTHIEVDVFGLHITVEQITDRRIEWAFVSKLLPSPEPDAIEK